MSVTARHGDAHPPVRAVLPTPPHHATRRRLRAECAAIAAAFAGEGHMGAVAPYDQNTRAAGTDRAAEPDQPGACPAGEAR